MRKIDRKFQHRHLDDVERIQEVMSENGNELSLSECAGMWSEYSDMFAAGWLGLPDSDSELWSILNSMYNDTI